jgi:hypothetical protein
MTVVKTSIVSGGKTTNVGSSNYNSSGRISSGSGSSSGGGRSEEQRRQDNYNAIVQDMARDRASGKPIDKAYIQNVANIYGVKVGDLYTDVVGQVEGGGVISNVPQGAVGGGVVRVGGTTGTGRTSISVGRGGVSTLTQNGQYIESYAQGGKSLGLSNQDRMSSFGRQSTFENLQDSIARSKELRTKLNLSSTQKAQMLKSLNEQSQKLRSLYNNRGTITPAQLKARQEVIKQNLKDIQTQQKNIITKTFKAGFNARDFIYEKALKPDISLTAIKRRVSITAKTVKNVVVLAGSGVKTAFNYGRGLVTRAQDRKTQAIKVLGGDVLKVNKFLYNTRKFIQQNPKESAIIAGIFAKNVGKAQYDAFKDDPEKFLIEQAVYTLGGTGVAKVFRSSQIGRVINEAKFIGRQPANIRPYVRAIIKGIKFQERLTPNKIKDIRAIKFSEVQTLNKIDAFALAKTMKETKSFIFGSVSNRAISKGLTKVPHDVDIATKNPSQFLKTFIKNIPKGQQKLYTIKGQKVFRSGSPILDLKPYSRLRPNENIFFRGELPINEIVLKRGKKVLQTGLTVPTQRLTSIKGIKTVTFGEQTARKGLGTLQVVLEKSARRAKDPASFIESIIIQRNALQQRLSKGFFNKFNLSGKYSLNQLNKAIKTLNNKNFEKYLIKNVKEVKDYPFPIKKIKEMIKLVKNKSFIKKVNAKYKNLVKTYNKTLKSKSSRIPSSRIPSSRIPRSRIPKTSRIPSSRLARSRIPTSRIPTSRIPTSRIPTSRVPTSRVPTSRIPSGRFGGKQATKENKLRLPRFSNKPQSTAGKLGLIKIKKGNKVYTFRSGLTFNRANALASKIVDNNKRASFEVKAYGRTTQRDIKPYVNAKFRLKKSKNPLVQRFVEKRKYRIDTKGEKQDLSIAKLYKKYLKRYKK